MYDPFVVSGVKHQYSTLHVWPVLLRLLHEIHVIEGPCYRGSMLLRSMLLMGQPSADNFPDNMSLTVRAEAWHSEVVGVQVQMMLPLLCNTSTLTH